MSPSRKLLIAGGLALALWGMSYGLYYAVSVEHQTLEHIGVSLATGFASAARGNMPSAHESLRQYSDANFAYTRQVDVHSHWIGLAMLLIALGAAFNRVAFAERLKCWLAAGLVAGSVIFPLGVILQTLDRGTGPKLIAVAGVALVTVSLAVVAIGFARRRRV
jgi:hypothetical protein